MKASTYISLIALAFAVVSPATSLASQYSHSVVYERGTCYVVTYFQGYQQTNAGFGMISTPVNQEVGRRFCVANPNDTRSCAQIKSHDDALMISMGSMTTVSPGLMNSIFESMARNAEQFWAKNCGQEVAPTGETQGTSK